jgi:hypothetical protein
MMSIKIMVDTKYLSIHVDDQFRGCRSRFLNQLLSFPPGGIFNFLRNLPSR